MPDLVAFIRARLDEDQAAAKVADGPSWFLDRTEDSDKRSIRYTGPSTLNPGDMADYYITDRVHECDAVHIARHDPARILRQVEALRAILNRHEPRPLGRWQVCTACCTAERFEFSGYELSHVAWPCPDVGVLASIWRDHPDYDEAWNA